MILRMRRIHALAPPIGYVLLLGVCLLFFPLPMVGPARAEEEYVYYGYVPRDIWGVEADVVAAHDIVSYKISLGSIRTYALLSIIGNADGTRAAVYTLPSRSLVKEVTLDEMEETIVSLPNGSFFKVVTDKPATVVLMGGEAMERGEAYTTSWVPSVGGGYVGKKFIFKALQGSTQPSTGLPYRVFALEAADVVVTDINGSQVFQFHLDANEVTELSFAPLRLFKLSATGNVMLQAFYIGWGFDPQGTSFYPAIEGGFIGKRFYGCGFKPELIDSPFIHPEYVVTGASESKLTLYDLEFKREHGTGQVGAGSRFATEIPVTYLMLESEQPAMLMLRSMGVAFAGLRAGQTAYLHVPTAENFTGEAYLFAYKETTVTIDDVASKLQADGIIPLTAGLHKVSTTENVVIQVLNWAAPSGLHYSYIGKPPGVMRIADFGQYLPSAQAMSIANENLRMEPVVVVGLPLTYVAAGAAGVIVIVVVSALALSRARRPKAAPS